MIKQVKCKHFDTFGKHFCNLTHQQTLSLPTGERWGLFSYQIDQKENSTCFFFCEGYNRNQPFPPSHLENWKMFPSNRLAATLSLLLAGSLVVQISALHQDQCCSRKMVGSVPYSLLFRCATYVASLTPILSNHFVRHLFEND